MRKECFAMDEPAIVAYITTALAGVETVTVSGDTFFFYRSERMMPFATLVTSDAHDPFSDLNRLGVFRLNIGVSKATFLALFGERPALPGTDDGGADQYDFTALDRLLPHPVYGRQYWLSVLNPSAETFDTTVRPLLTEAYASAVRKYERRGARG